MRNIILSMSFMMTILASFAQNKSDTSKHLSFKGVPINGTLADFVSKMKAGGFSNKESNKGIELLEGDFASYKNCVVTVSTMKQKDLVSNIGVTFSDCETWSALYSNYNTLKELLTEKYGKPTQSREEFQGRTRDIDDRFKMYEVRSDRCKYVTSYETEKGTIQLSIEHEGVSRCFVKLAYIDKINSEAVKKQALDDL